jgi:hypothetical protein
VIKWNNNLYTYNEYAERDQNKEGRKKERKKEKALQGETE